MANMGRRFKKPLFLGREVKTGEPISLGRKWFETHLHVLGPPGSGKTRLLLWIFEYLAQIPSATIILINPKGDLARMARDWAVGHGLSILRARSIPGDRLEALALPTLVLWGRRDRLIPPEHGSQIAKHIPGARHVVITGAGHMPFYEKPAEFNRHVLDFLR